MRPAAHSSREVVTALAVLLALAAVTAFSLWGMKPSTASPSAAPAVTAPATPAPRVEGDEGD